MTNAITKAQKPTKSATTIARVSFDLGNRFNAITDGKQIINFPSYSKRKAAKQDIDYTSSDFITNQSFVVTVDGNDFVIGKAAGELFAKPTFGGDKWSFVHQFLYSGLSALVPQEATIEQLFCTVPDDQDAHQVQPFKNLANKTHKFSVNGREFSVTIKNVLVSAEGRFAWHRAIKEGLYAHNTYQNAVLDLGGGTAIARLFTTKGQIVREYELVLDGGTSALASAIASEVGMPGAEGQILDAIADGTFAVHAVNFKDAYDALLPEWVANIRNDINTSWKSIQTQYAQILVVGGSAPIVAPFLAGNARYVIAPNPQFYALEGMQAA